MKKLWIICLVNVVFACQPLHEDSFTITGTVEGLDEGKVYLQDRIDGLMVNVDSAEVQNGKFEFTGRMDHPELYYLNLEGVASRLAIFVENTSIEVYIDSENPSRYTVVGSGSHDIYSGLSDVIAPFDESIRHDQQELQKAEREENIALTDQLRTRVEQNQKLRKEAILQYIEQYPEQPAAVFLAIRQLSHGLDHDELGEILRIFEPGLAGSRYYDDLANRVDDLERVAIGRPAIDFTLPDPDGNEISLSDYHGKYVLLSFWASWCPFCRVESPEIVAAYEKLASYDFEIITVSLDRDYEAWVKGIEEDGFTWPQVSDLEGWRSGPASQYVVRSIPQNILIDPEGVIVARNLKYSELQELIPRLLKTV